MKNEEEEEGTNLVQGMDKHTWSHIFASRNQQIKSRGGVDQKVGIGGFQKGVFGFYIRDKKKMENIAEKQKGP